MEKILKNYLLSFYPSTSIDDDNISKKELVNNTCVIGYGNKYIIIRFNDKYFRMKREENFDLKDKIFIQDVLDTISRVLISDSNFTDKIFYASIIENSFNLAVLRKVFTHNYVEFMKVFQCIEYWRNKTHENKSVCLGIEVENTNESQINNKQIKLTTIMEEDYFAPISDGMRTFVKVDMEGNFTGTSIYEVESSDSLIPIRFSAVSININSIFIILTRLGDILIISNGELKYAKKGSRWIEYNHEKLINRLTATVGIKNKSLRHAIYLSCLDVSFAKSGGIIAVMHNKNFSIHSIMTEVMLQSVHMKDKNHFFKTTYGNKFFNTVPRQLRKKLLAVDGSLIITNQGQIKSVGAIVSVPGGSNGGGRTAAAVELSNHGLAIKISEDGYIQLYRNGERRPELMIL